MMKAIILKGVGSLTDQPAPLTLSHVPVPEPAEQEVLLWVSGCGVCHTDLDELEGRATPLEAANQAQQKIKPGRIRGVKVLLVHPML